MIQVYHNARCSKSRECLAFLNETGQEFEVIKYLEQPPTFNELKSIIKKLGIAPIDLVRKKEPVWISHFKGAEMSFTVLPHVTVSYNEKNCLVIHAPRISDDLIVTNDVVELINENQFIFLGRADNIINSGGIKHLPEQIENKLSGKISSRFFIAGLHDLVLGEKLALIIEGEPQDIDNSIFEGLGKYEKPKEIIFVPKFLETGSGKIMRKEILRLLDK